MNVNRRQFGVGLTAATLAFGSDANLFGQQPTDATRPSSGVSHTPYFFKHPTFEYVFLTSLGRAYHMAGNVGKVLYLSKQIEDGNFESAFQSFKLAGDEARSLAEESLGKGHHESARQAYLWAQNFYDTSTYFVDGSQDPSRFEPTWQLLYDCWLKAIPLFNPAIEAVTIPYENTELHGFFFRGPGPARKRPLLILVNGSDGSLLDMWIQGGAAALARGYDCLTFDGPGQGYALWKQKLFFRPDWEKIITPVVNYAVTRSEVDSKRIAIQGISQGGYWVPRAAAFEKRIAAVIADPGVVDVSTSWTASMPKPMLELLQGGHKAEFDGFMSKANPAAAANLRFRMRPYGFTSYFDTYKATMEYNLTEIAGEISCPVLITEPANESFWPGQSRILHDLLRCSKKLLHFSESDGADLHCEPKGAGLRELHVFNWLDEILK